MPETTPSLSYPNDSAAIYAHVRSRTAPLPVWNGSSLVTWVDANYTTYVLSATNYGGYQFAADVPTALPAGNYSVTYRLRAGASPAKTDLVIGKCTMTWSGTVVTLTDSDGVDAGDETSLTIIQGDDYLGSIGTALTLVVEGYTGPSLTGGSAQLALMSLADWQRSGTTPALTVTGTASLVDTTLTCSFDITSAQSAALEVEVPGDADNYRYQLRALTSAGKQVTKRLGVATVTREVFE